jgi:hypothetical protein
MGIAILILVLGWYCIKIAILGIMQYYQNYALPWMSLHILNPDGAP